MLALYNTEAETWIWTVFFDFSLKYITHKGVLSLSIYLWYILFTNGRAVSI